MKSKTPIKIFEGRAKWSDHTHLQLLKLYMQKALDPFERPSFLKGGPKSKAVFRTNAPEEGDLYQNSTIYTDSGDKVMLHNFTSHDSMVVQLGQRKLSGQTFGTGLVNIIDKFFEDQDLPKNKEYLEEVVDEIIEFAKQFMKDPSSK